MITENISHHCNFIFVCFWERYKKKIMIHLTGNISHRGNYNICLFLGEILLFLFMITGNVSHRGNYNICLFLGDILLFLFMITGNVSHSGNYNICLLLGEILLYPLQTKFGGVYRNHPVCPSVHVPCKRNSS